MKLYTASSWRNEEYDVIVKQLQGAGYEVYDFKTAKMEGRSSAFNWDEIDPNWENWNNKEFIQAMTHKLAHNAFTSDKGGRDGADVCVLILPCGKSAHLEAGYMKGLGKPLLILIEEKGRPELTYKLADGIYTDVMGLLHGLIELEEKIGGGSGIRLKEFFDRRRTTSREDVIYSVVWNMQRHLTTSVNASRFPLMDFPEARKLIREEIQGIKSGQMEPKEAYDGRIISYLEEFVKILEGSN